MPRLDLVLLYTAVIGLLFVAWYHSMEPKR